MFPGMTPPIVQPSTGGGGGKMPQGGLPVLDEKQKMLMAIGQGLMEGSKGQLQDIGGGYQMRVRDPLGGAMGAGMKVYGDIDAEKRAEKKRLQERKERMEDRTKIFEMEEAAREKRDTMSRNVATSRRAADQLLAETRRMEDRERALADEARRRGYKLEDTASAQAREDELYGKRRGDILEDKATEQAWDVRKMELGQDFAREQYDTRMEDQLTEKAISQEFELEKLNLQNKFKEPLQSAQIKSYEARATPRTGVTPQEISIRKEVANSLADSAADLYDEDAITQDPMIAVYDEARRIILQEGGSHTAAIEKAKKILGYKEDPKPTPSGNISSQQIIDQL
jgi:hypothetical protein